MKLSVVDAISFPQKAVVALVNHKKQKHYVVYTTNTIGFFLKTVQQLRDGTHPMRELNMDKEDLVLEMYYNLEHIQENDGIAQLIGYTLRDTYNRNMPYITYDSPKYLKYRVFQDIMNIDGRYIIVLKVKINRKTYIVGEYNSVESAKARYSDSVVTLLTEAYQYQGLKEIVSL